MQKAGHIGSEKRSLRDSSRCHAFTIARPWVSTQPRQPDRPGPAFLVSTYES
jgi:hypothetical protein